VESRERKHMKVKGELLEMWKEKVKKGNGWGVGIDGTDMIKIQNKCTNVIMKFLTFTSYIH
jgi:hypothetical protein